MALVWRLSARGATRLDPVARESGRGPLATASVSARTGAVSPTVGPVVPHVSKL